MHKGKQWNNWYSTDGNQKVHRVSNLHTCYWVHVFMTDWLSLFSEQIQVKWRVFPTLVLEGCGRMCFPYFSLDFPDTPSLEELKWISGHMPMITWTRLAPGALCWEHPSGVTGSQSLPACNSDSLPQISQHDPPVPSTVSRAEESSFRHCSADCGFRKGDPSCRWISGWVLDINQLALPKMFLPFSFASYLKSAE